MTDSPGDAQPRLTQPPLHYQFTPAVAQELRSLNLSAAEWRLWSYLVTLDPFGNRFQELPNVEALIQECRMSKATFYRALATFEQHQLFDVMPLRVAFKNLRGQRIVSRMRQNSHPCEKTLTDETKFASVRQNSHPCENRSPQAAQYSGSTALQISSERSDLSQIPPPTPEPREKDEALLQFVTAQNKTVRSPRAYAKRCIQEDREYWESEFLKYTERIEKANLPPPLPDPNENPLLLQLQAQWRRSDPNGREAIAQAIERHPDWGLAVAEGAIVEVKT